MTRIKQQQSLNNRSKSSPLSKSNGVSWSGNKGTETIMRAAHPSSHGRFKWVHRLFSRNESPELNYICIPDYHWAPQASTAFKILFFMRIFAATWCPIMDCDETYNYWEPLHLLLYGTGQQTWEYSPEYAIRSYAFLFVYFIPAKLFQILLPLTSKVAVFFLLRCSMAIISAFSDLLLYNAICQKLSSSIGRICLCFQALGVGMFISGCAMLPSSFSMVMTSFAYALWLQGKDFLAIFAIATSAMLSWPFAALLGVPLAVDYVFVRADLTKFFFYSVVSAVLLLAFLVPVDFYFYGKLVIAPLNIIWYNVFSSSRGLGPNLYGVEPWTFYVKNLLLNWNVAFVIALLTIPSTAVLFYLYFRHNNWRQYRVIFIFQLGFWLWLLVFCCQPHKEERFLFPMFPLICVSAALGVDAVQRIINYFCSRSKRWRSRAKFFALPLLLFFACVSISRTVAIYRNYHAVLETYLVANRRFVSLDSSGLDGIPTHLNKTGTSAGRISTSYRSKSSSEKLVLCLGKEWYRFHSSFFLPETIELRFIKSKFSGLLPKPFAKLPVPETTKLVPTEMNDLNREEPGRYAPVDSCDFMIDFDNGDPSTVEPQFSADTKTWKLLSGQKFLISVKSSQFFRSFYVPWLSDDFCVFGSYVFLEQSPKHRSRGT